MIEVTFDSNRKLVRAVMSGLLTKTDIELFSRKEQEAVRQMGLGSGEFFLLVEAEGDVVQSQEVVEAFKQLMLHSPVKAKRIATVRAGALPTIQTRRIASVRSNAEVFSTVREAEAWLFE
jgi:hypothetical protein